MFANQGRDRELEALVDLERYPLHRPNNHELDELLRGARREFEDIGSCVLPGFLTSEGRGRIAAEAEALAAGAHRADERCNPYFMDDDPSLPGDHPRRRFNRHANTIVLASQLDETGALRRLHRWPPLLALLCRIFDIRRLYPYGDPISGMTVNLLDPGDEFCWHFDTNDFTANFSLRSAERGGRFEFYPDIRDGEDENYDTVRQVLDGRRDGVYMVPLRPGDLSLFRGRNSIHRVSRVEGGRRRITAAMGYTRRPNVLSKPFRTQALYGIGADRRPERAEMHKRADGLLD